MKTELHTFFNLDPMKTPIVSQEELDYLKNIGTSQYKLPISTEEQLKTITPIKYDQSKTDWSLVPMECIEDIAKVLEFGAQKYSPNNWREGNGFKWTRVLNSLFRHIFAFARGEDNDPETGLSHLAHAGCNIIFLLYYVKHRDKYNNDDRFK